MAWTVSEKKLRRRMVEREIYSIQELVRRSGVTDKTFRQWFSGGNFTSDAMARVCAPNALDCHPNDITEYAPDPVPHAQAPAFA